MCNFISFSLQTQLFQIHAAVVTALCGSEVDNRSSVSLAVVGTALLTTTSITQHLGQPLVNMYRVFSYL